MAQEVKIMPQEKNVHKSVWIAWMLLVIGLAATAAAAAYVKRDIDSGAEKSFDFACNRIQIRIHERMRECAQLLIDAAALFDASEEVTREKWHAFTQGQKIDQNLPGITGVGFSLLIPREGLAQHIQDIRNEGFPEYQVKPEYSRDTYTSIIWLEPFSGRNLRAFGFDMFSEPVRRTAMEQARDTNAPVISGKVVLVQETGQDVQAGNLMYVPVYRKGMPAESVAERCAALYGWVYSPYRMKDLMQGILGGWESETGKQIRLQIFDDRHAADDTLLYDSRAQNEAETPEKSRLTLLTPVNLNGHTWFLRFTQPDGQPGYGSVYSVSAAGATISLLLFSLFLSLLSTRFRAQRLADHLIEDIRKSEEKIHELNRDVISFLENTTDFVSFKDDAGRYRFCSQAMAELTGHKSWRDMVGKHVLDVFPEDTARIYHAEDLSILHDSKPMLNKVNPYYDTSGEPGWVSASKWPLLNDEGKVIGVFGITREITEMKRMEDTILHTNEMLEERVAQEVQKNMEQERLLAHQSRMSAMSEMLGNIAHQWRQPLSSLSILLYNIKDACQFNELDKVYMDRAFADGNRIIQKMSATITDFHSFFSMDKEMSVFPVREQIEKAVALVKSDFMGHHISIYADDLQDLMIPGYPRQFSQVLLNILINAKEAILKHDPPGPGRVEITAEEQDGQGCVTVRDTGIGIPEDILYRIFEPYFSTRERGAGIGLYLSKTIIERRMNGSIRAENFDGGAEFRIFVPLAKEDVWTGHAADEPEMTTTGINRIN